MGISATQSTKMSKGLAKILFIFVLFEFARPQDFIPLLGLIKPGLLLMLALLFFTVPDIVNLRFSESQTKAFVFLNLLMIVNVPIASNNYHALWTWVAVLQYFIFYMAIVRHVDDILQIRRIVDFWLCIMVVAAVVGIFSGGRVPGSSVMGDENDFALLLNMALPVALFLAQEEKTRKRAYYLIAAGLFVAAVVMSLSRGGFIGLASVCVYIWIKSSRKVLMTVLVLLLAFTALVAAPESYWEEIQSIGEENIEAGTGAERWYTWMCGLRMFLDNPILGAGQGNFPWVVARYEPPGGFHDWSIGGRVAHSVYFTLLPELGIVGALLFTVLVYKTARQTFKAISVIARDSKPKEERRGLAKALLEGFLGAMVGYLVSGVFLSVLYYPNFWFFLALFLPVLAYVSREYQVSLD